MANNYLQFSEAFKLDTDAQVEWVEDLFEKLEKADDVDDEEYEKLAELLGVPTGEDVEDYIATVRSVFEFNRAERVLYASTEEGCNIDTVVNVLQAMLNNTKSDSIYKIEWAETCSKPRCGEFGGGACVVSREEILFESTGSAVDRLIGKINTKRLRKANAAARKAERSQKGA